jgi:histidyl-tRNA synthetase
MKKDNSPARGTRDLLPDLVRTREHVLTAITGVYQRFGYQRIETPALEGIERLQGGQGGENEKLIFQILRRGLPALLDSGTPVSELIDLGLRFDLTVPLTRFYAANQSALRLPFRSMQIGPVWRAERPQRGRFRQFIQCDIDVIGEPRVLAEAELIEATTAALRAVGLADTCVRVSDRRLLGAVAQTGQLPQDSWPTFFVALDKLDKIGWDGVRAEMADKGLPADATGRVLELIEHLQNTDETKIADTLTETLPDLDERVIADLATTAACLNALGMQYGRGWQFDPTLVRGMGYYTGQIFEVSHHDMPGSLAGGGRYDRLIGLSSGRDVPACGFSIGFERITELLSQTPPARQVALLAEADVPVPDVVALATRLRADGRDVVVVPRSGKLGAQLGRLEAWGFTSVLPVQLREGHAHVETERPLGQPEATQ